MHSVSRAAATPPVVDRRLARIGTMPNAKQTADPDPLFEVLTRRPDGHETAHRFRAKDAAAATAEVSRPVRPASRSSRSSGPSGSHSLAAAGCVNATPGGATIRRPPPRDGGQQRPRLSEGAGPAHPPARHHPRERGHPKPAYTGAGTPMAQAGGSRERVVVTRLVVGNRRFPRDDLGLAATDALIAAFLAR